MNIFEVNAILAVKERSLLANNTLNSISYFHLKKIVT